MPPPLPRQAILLHLSVTSQDISVFAHNVEARHLLHYSHHIPLVSQRVGYFPRLQCSLYATAYIVVRPTGMISSTFARTWDFYYRACSCPVTLSRVDYNYLGEQTTPRAGLSPAGNAALWAAHVANHLHFIAGIKFAIMSVASGKFKHRCKMSGGFALLDEAASRQVVQLPTCE